MRGLVRLSTETDRVYTINLGKVLLSPNNRRAKRAINMIREFARHHMGISEVKIDMDVSHIIWSKGIRSPPRKIRVRMRKTDEGNILISKYEADPTAPSKVEDAKAKPDDTKEIPAKADAGSKPADVKKIPAPAKDVAKPDAKAKPADTKKIPDPAKEAAKPDAKAKPADAKKIPAKDVAKPDAKSKPADTKKAPAKDDTKSDAKAKSTSK